MTAKIVAVANSKGGVGKTLIALHLAISAAIDSKNVLFVDGDRQATGCIALQCRAEQHPDKPRVAFVSLPDGRRLMEMVRKETSNRDVIIIDVGGYDAQTLRAALLLADTVVVPFQPRSFDIWGIGGIAELIKATKEIRGDFPALAVLSLAEPSSRSADNRDAAQAVGNIPVLTYVDAPITRRKAYSNAASFGLSVKEARPTDRKAVAEIDRLAEVIFSTQEAKDGN